MCINCVCEVYKHTCMYELGGFCGENFSAGGHTILAHHETIYTSWLSSQAKATIIADRQTDKFIIEVTKKGQVF